MNTLEKTKQIMKENSIIAKKSFGQNFLVDDNILKEIVEASNVKRWDTVIEIGPGLGNLTEYILQTGAKVIAYEIDQDMIDLLLNRFNGKNIEIRKQDILKVDLNYEVLSKEKNKIKVIANIPYYITTPIIFKLLEYKEKIESITIMIQKEVADRIMAAPRSKDYGVLTVNTNCVTDVVKLFDVPSGSFIPAPNVTSSVIKLLPNVNKPQLLKIMDQQVFNALVKSAFSSRRKKVSNSLLNSGIYNLGKKEIEDILLQVGLDLNSRAEEIAIEQYATMSNIILKKLKK